MKIPGNFRWWRDNEDRVAGYPARHLAVYHGWTHGFRITYEADWVALRKVRSDAVATFLQEGAMEGERFRGAEGMVFWDCVRT